MTRLQEEMIRADEEGGGSVEDESEMFGGASKNDSKKDQLALSNRRNLSKSTVLVSERNQPKLLDDSHIGYSTFQLLDILG
jgi:hypothetical protein